jgi:predicted ATPase
VLNTLTIDGFKLFSSVSVPRLARINLFVGSNNAGKSCLLEAIRLLVTNGNLAVIRDLVRSRDGDWEANIARRSEFDEELAINRETPIRFLFHDFHCEGDPGAAIEIASDDPSRRLRLSLGLYRSSREEDGSLRRLRIEKDSEEPIEDAEEMLEIFLGGERRRVVRLDSFWGRRGYLGRPAYPEDPAQRPLVNVGTNGIGSDEIALLWDRVSITPLQDQILACLRLIEPRIEGLALIGDATRNGERERTPVIRVAESEERYPLRTMGDGLTRLFHIALAIVNAQDGVVLIDEFENGLYWEVQEQLWPVLFKLAQQFDVQLFVTTHSSDCIQSFVRAWKGFPSQGSMYRIERTKGSARILGLPMTNVSDALASQVEVR